MGFEEVDFDEDEEGGGEGGRDGEGEGIAGGCTRPGDAVEAEEGVDEAEEEAKEEGDEDGCGGAEVEWQSGVEDGLAKEGGGEGDKGIDDEPGEEARGEGGEGTPEEGGFFDGAVAQAREEGDGRPEDDVDIGEEVAVADVELVEAQLGGQDGLEVLLVGVGVIAEDFFFVAVEDGGGGGDAGADGEDEVADGRIPLRCDGGIFGAGTDEGHIANEDVPELGEFIEFGMAQELSEGGDALVAGGGDAGAVVAVFGFVHGAELENAEGFAVTAGAGPAVEDGAGGVVFEADGDVEKEGA